MNEENLMGRILLALDSGRNSEVKRLLPMLEYETRAPLNQAIRGLHAETERLRRECASMERRRPGIKIPPAVHGENMKIRIKSRWGDKVLYEVEADSIKQAVELAFNSGADLSGANLSGANLYGANLYGAKNFNKHLVTPLLMLKDQTGKIRAYKLVKADGLAPFNGCITYELKKSYEIKEADTDENVQCGKGINLATLDWCMKEWKEGYRILVAEFTAKDIAAIPTASDGKFRVFRCKIVQEKDLKEIGLVK